jgi:hypothetical protein
VAKFLALIRYSIFVLYNSGLEVLIIVVENYEEFKEQSISQFFDDYFIEKVNEEIIEVDITKEHIVDLFYITRDLKC